MERSLPRVAGAVVDEAPYLGAVWLDRAEMEEGVGRWRQITEVIDRSEFMMLVMSRLAVSLT